MHTGLALSKNNNRFWCDTRCCCHKRFRRCIFFSEPARFAYIYNSRLFYIIGSDTAFGLRAPIIISSKRHLPDALPGGTCPGRMTIVVVLLHCRYRINLLEEEDTPSRRVSFLSHVLLLYHTSMMNQISIIILWYTLYIYSMCMCIPPQLSVFATQHIMQHSTLRVRWRDHLTSKNMLFFIIYYYLYYFKLLINDVSCREV